MTKKPSAKASKKRGVPRSTGRRCVIRASCRSFDAVYDVLARDLGFPAHFGRNLDALWDCLTGEVPGPFAIVVEDAAALERALGAKGAAFLALLRDVGRERKDARIALRGGR